MFQIKLQVHINPNSEEEEKKLIQRATSTLAPGVTLMALSKSPGLLLCILGSPVGATSHLLSASHSDNCQADGCLTRE